MVKLEAIKKNGVILISEDSFEHLLNCLANQKFIGELPPNGDALDMSPEAYKSVQAKNQAAIDDFWKQCMDLLTSDVDLSEELDQPSCGGGCQGCR